MVNGESMGVNAQGADPVKALSQAAIGRVLGLAPATMTKLKGQGMPVDSVESARAWREARQNIAARKPEPIRQPARVAQPAPDYGRVGGDEFREVIRANQVNFDGSEMDEAFDSARTREKIADANKAEMVAAAMAGTYVEKSRVERAIFEAARGLRDGMTNCSRRLAAEVATLTTPTECEEIISKELRHLLDAFSKQLAQKIAPTEATAS